MDKRNIDAENSSNNYKVDNMKSDILYKVEKQTKKWLRNAKDTRKKLTNLTKDKEIQVKNKFF